MSNPNLTTNTTTGQLSVIIRDRETGRTWTCPQPSRRDARILARRMRLAGYVATFGLEVPRG